MNEWAVVLVISTLASLFLLVGKPIVKLNSTIVTLIAKLDNLEKNYSLSSKKNDDEHKEFRTQIQDVEGKLSEHEGRIAFLEKSK